MWSESNAIEFKSQTLASGDVKSVTLAKHWNFSVFLWSVEMQKSVSDQIQLSGLLFYAWLSLQIASVENTRFVTVSNMNRAG